MLLQAKALPHTKDGERLLVSLTLQSSSKLSPYFNGSKGDERMPLVKTSCVLQLASLQPAIMGSLSLWGTLSTFPLMQNQKSQLHVKAREAQCPFLTGSAG